MASPNRSLIIFALVVTFVPAISFAAQFIVGGDAGWALNVDYTAWAKDKHIFVGDTLVFKYNSEFHNVFKLANEADFQSCNIPTNKSLGTFTGNDSIELKTAGNKWYACGVGHHCLNGMKLKITVESESDSVPSPTPAPAPSAVSPPESPY